MNKNDVPSNETAGKIQNYYDAHTGPEIVKDGASTAAGAAKEYVIDPVADGVTTAAHAVGDNVAQPAVDGVVSAASAVGDGVKDAAGAVADKAKEGLDTVKGWFGG